MQYLYDDTDSSINFANYIQTINAINFENHIEVIADDIYVVTLRDTLGRLDGRISSAINNTSAITQSLRLEGRNIHLIVINEDLCNNMDVISIILHEMGHILNEFGTLITPMQAIQGRIINFNELNREIRLNNELSADFYAKKHGYGDSLIANLAMSLGRGYDDAELRLRIECLQSEREFNLNHLRTHNL
ncbi:hypothetical protein GCM10022422_16420 [Flavobacterium ginsengisoli]|uniref:IrrE N-terminal-like domain-containing protein n=1 Tax=Flavobacterium ginsengisoli TaxID=871694 RepID=A0ABP7FBE4_9FLAO|nr:hypothetical protein [Flavobacterium ginsengisoli]